MQFSSTGSSPEFPLAISDSSSVTKGLNFKHLLHSQRIPGWVRLEGSSGPTSLPIPELTAQDCEQSFTLALLLTPKSWPPSCQNKPPHTDPRKSSHLGGRCHHQLWVVNFIFSKGEKKISRKIWFGNFKKLHLLAKSCVRECVPDSCRSKCIQGESAGPGHMDTHLVLGGFVLGGALAGLTAFPIASSGSSVLQLPQKHCRERYSQ